jgi:hypothetical protein
MPLSSFPYAHLILLLHAPFSLSFKALYAFFNNGISSLEVFSAIQETEDINDVVESVGEGGPEGI